MNNNFKWRDFIYQSSSTSQKNKVRDLPTPYLRNILNKLSLELWSNSLQKLVERFVRAKDVQDTSFTAQELGQLALLAEYLLRKLEHHVDVLFQREFEDEMRKIEIQERELAKRKADLMLKGISKTVEFDRN